MWETCSDELTSTLIRALMALAGLDDSNKWDTAEHGAVNIYVINTWAQSLKNDDHTNYFPLPHVLLTDIHLVLAQMNFLHQEIEKAFAFHGAAFQLQLRLLQIRTATFAIERITGNYHISFVRFLLLPREIQYMIWAKADVQVDRNRDKPWPFVRDRTGQIQYLHHGCSYAKMKFALYALQMDFHPQQMLRGKSLPAYWVFNRVYRY